MLGRGGLRLGGWFSCPPLTPLFIGGREKGAAPLEPIYGGCGGLGERGEGGLPPKPRGRPLKGSPLNPWRKGPREGVRPAHQGLAPSPTQPMWPPGRGGPSRWTPRTLPVAPVQYRYDPETSRCPFDNFPYINLYLRTIPDLLVTSRIPYGTPNNIR